MAYRKLGKATLRLVLQNDFDIGYSNSLPLLGSSSRDLRIVSEAWNPAHDELTLQLSGIPGSRYELNLRNPGQIRSVDDAELKNANLLITLPPGNSLAFTPYKIVLHFAPAKPGGK